jgi:hypothetical protein
MKIQMILLCLSLLIISCSAGKKLVNVPAGETVEVDYSEYKNYTATIKNRSFKSLDVAVLNKETGKQVSSFGLGMKGKVEVIVKEENKLVFKNEGKSNVKLKIGVEPDEPKMAKKPKQKQAQIQKKKPVYISFTLENTTAKSIPLIIPTVMNPNLSPFSKSGVDLKIGQEVLFRAKGKKRVLLTVDDTIKNGDVLDVAKILKARKKELGL